MFTVVDGPTKGIADAAGEFSQCPLAVVYIGQHSVILSGAAYIPITDRFRGLAPGGISVLPGDFARLRTIIAPHIHVRFRFSTRLLPWDLRVRRHCNPGLVHEALAPLVATHDPELRDRSAYLHSQLAFSTDLLPAVTALVGCGKGATPAGDDVLVGTLAGLRLTGNQVLADQLATTLRPLLYRTTRSSCQDLTAAIEGRFCERLHRLIASATRDDVATASRNLATWGTSSGYDTTVGLTGAIAACA
jgi:hypothetical protein